MSSCWKREDIKSIIWVGHIVLVLDMHLYQYTQTEFSACWIKGYAKKAELNVIANNSAFKEDSFNQLYVFCLMNKERFNIFLMHIILKLLNLIFHQVWLVYKPGSNLKLTILFVCFFLWKMRFFKQKQNSITCV